MASWNHNYFGARRPHEYISSSPAPPFGDLIQTLKLSDLKDNTSSSAPQITDFKPIGSYSWLDKKSGQAEILIPGQPPRWTPQTHPTPLREDSGTYYRDKNAARYPHHPTEPAILTTLTSDPSLPSNIDLFACGSTLGNLLRFARDTDKDRPFRMLAYKMGKTVFLVRRENSPTETIPGVRGFGHAFPEANTSWDAEVKGSVSHQRVVGYRVGDTSIAVRFEADGYISEEKTKGVAGLGKAAEASSLDDLTSALSSLTPITPNPITSRETKGETPLKTTQAGTTIPHTSLFDLKTRSIRTRPTQSTILAGELPRLWLSRVSQLILAYHTRGLFPRHDIEILDVRGEVDKWEETHKTELKRFSTVLEWVRENVGRALEENGWDVVEICRRAGGDRLELRRAGGKVYQLASKEVRERWVGVVEGDKVDEKKGSNVDKEEMKKEIEKKQIEKAKTRQKPTKQVKQKRLPYYKSREERQQALEDDLDELHLELEEKAKKMDETYEDLLLDLDEKEKEKERKMDDALDEFRWDLEEKQKKEEMALDDALEERKERLEEEWNKFDEAYDAWRDDRNDDFTACSADHCGYCGRCSY